MNRRLKKNALDYNFYIDILKFRLYMYIAFANEMVVNLSTFIIKGESGTEPLTFIKAPLILCLS